MNRLSCKDYRLLISRKVDNDLKEEELIDLNSHIDKCKDCHLHNKKIYSLKNIININSNVGGEYFFHFSHIPQKRKPVNFLKYVSVIAASVFLFIIMFSVYLYIDENNYIADNDYYDYSEEYYPMSAFIFYQNLDSNKDSSNGSNNYDIFESKIYDNGYFQYMMSVNY